jgi:hypothetical protein
LFKNCWGFLAYIYIYIYFFLGDDFNWGGELRFVQPLLNQTSSYKIIQKADIRLEWLVFLKKRKRKKSWL